MLSLFPPAQLLYLPLAVLIATSVAGVLAHVGYHMVLETSPSASAT